MGRLTIDQAFNNENYLPVKNALLALHRAGIYDGKLVNLAERFITSRESLNNFYNYTLPVTNPTKSVTVQ